MALSFFPFQKGQRLTPEILNELVQAIQDGSIFTSTSFVSGLVTTLDTRVDTLETTVTALETVLATNSIREQFTMTTGQSTVALSKTPVLDTDLVFLNGKLLHKDGVPAGFSGEYTVSGSTLTLVSTFAATILAGDKLAMTYSFEVA